MSTFFKPYHKSGIVRKKICKHVYCVMMHTTSMQIGLKVETSAKSPECNKILALKDLHTLT
ncbi:MAG: hypothetical protein COY39_01935 [Alphaproteobacteria bacterium CG_4_10_14_0_8_um_filter_37_21]|nr:MAG: hypothetical protein COY39_01935 [Alphaproteobacteria bacterium CG_4_10_14_0_8_um_filter_37_21]